MIKNTWTTFIYNIDNKFINELTIRLALDKFFEENLKHLFNQQYVIIQFKIIDNNNIWRSVSYLQTVIIKDFKELYKNFSYFWNKKSENYSQFTIKSIVFSYKILPLESKIKENKINTHISDSTKDTFTFGGFDLPCTMDFTKWGEVYFNEYYSQVIVDEQNSDIKYYISLHDNHMEVKIKNGNNILLEFKDIMNNQADLDTFTRIIKNQEYNFINGKLSLKLLDRKVSYLKSIKPSLFLTEDFITMDLETKEINGVLVPYCVGIFDGKDKTSFFLLDYKSSDLMLEDSIKHLMRRKYDDYKIYLHNFSYFDGVFLLRILSKLSNNIKPIIRDGRLIDIKFTHYVEGTKSKYTLYFRDSYLMLPSSLRSLAKNFSVEEKGIFPFRFVNNKNINLDYCGKFPRTNFFDLTTDQTLDFIAYKSQFNNKAWNLREESIRYCEQDCVTLHQIISKFNLKIFSRFRVDIHRYPTLSSLAFGIFRAKFLDEKEFKIPLIHGEIYNFIKRSYKGGSTEAYIPTGKNIHSYDVNSLYPTAMKTFNMPTGEPKYFEGDILERNPSAFGFFEVRVKAPFNLNIPVLQTRINNKTITPTGSWTDVYFSEEIKSAMKLGYKFEILRGYLFERKNIFKEYVDFLYEMKLNSKKGTPDYTISKLLLNSLYGRLGMNPNMETHKIVRIEEVELINLHHKATNLIDFKNGKGLISYYEEINDNQNNQESFVNVSVGISSAITAYSRIHMFNLIHELIRLGYKIYYMDTDSLYVDKSLPIHLIGKELGKLKLEDIFKEAVFLAPKVYNGKNISKLRQKLEIEKVILLLEHKIGASSHLKNYFDLIET